MMPIWVDCSGEEEEKRQLFYIMRHMSLLKKTQYADTMLPDA